MELAQSLSQRQTMQMGGQMLTSLAILGMGSQDLAEHLAEQARSNPYLRYRAPAAFTARGGAVFDAVAAVAAHRPSLMAHVVAQIEMAFADPARRAIALRFAEALEPTGWLGQSVAAVAMASGVGQTRAEAVLRVLQGFEPAGLFARDLAECLTLQARDADILTWELQVALAHLPLLAQNRRAELAELCDCELSDIPGILRQIRQLNPKPGLAFDPAPLPVFPPDLIASRGPGGWQVSLNRATTPAITVREDRLPDGRADAAARAERRKALAEARALAQALERRGDTLLRTAAVLVARQSAFLDGGAAHLLPLTLDDVALELGLHASTISRAVSGRMIQTPLRALPLRMFFSRAVSAQDGGEGVSRDSAMAFVSRMVRAEDPQSPLSDDAIVVLARQAGLQLARRTVAKYRCSLGLASSYERRRPSAAPCAPEGALA